MFKDEHIYEDIYELKKSNKLPEIFKLENPGVPYVFFNMRANPTPIALEWEDHLKTYYKD